MDKSLLRLLKFGVVGISNTVIDVFVFSILVHFFHLSTFASQCISYTCGVANSYIFNRTWTFKRKEKSSIKEVSKFIAVNVLTLLVTVSLLQLLTKNIGLSLLISKAITIVVGLLVNFIGTRLFVFQEKEAVVTNE